MMCEGSDTRDWFITLGTPFMYAPSLNGQPDRNSDWKQEHRHREGDYLKIYY